MAESSASLLSVVITSYDSQAILRLCLDALVRQPEIGCIVVSDCSPVDPAGEFAPLFPQVRFLHSPQPRSVPELRWAALAETDTELVAAIESRCVPAPDWAAQLVEAHQLYPETPAIGGPVAPSEPISAFDWALYFCEYGAFAPPLEPGPAQALSGANLSYKRAALEQHRDLLDSGDWETFLHARWLAAGRPLRLCPASIRFHNTMTPAAALRQRYHYGRGYAADRVRCEGVSGLFYALLSPLLPLVLTLRQSRQAFAKGMRRAFVRALGWVVLLNAAWSIGEGAGYLFGPDPRPRIF
ncbi:MAG: glycosyltransferase [Bryobacterales bacterium]